MAHKWYDHFTVWLKIGLALQLVSTILFIVGFSTDVWIFATFREDARREYGLWRYLFYTYSSRYEDMGAIRANIGNNAIVITRSDWYRATQAMECFGLICIVIATFLLLLYFFVASCKRRNALLATIVFTFASVGFIVIGIAIFASKFDNYGYEVGWSMGLAIAAAILAFVAGIMEVLEIK
ncbi:uncharacterized protein LOC110455464 isoform X1 [Mizuhopecten yessoensis]|uniref:uncharacterized protein LOC110455464 isoform X1 n=1 Tax=Mizuhopecten yessoensis TaxID=6573 RepID=UPI000B457C8A|nr:uncharacterized protein LOC110455464 isoform X1 [Mizuhopecten yessoensis]